MVKLGLNKQTMQWEVLPKYSKAEGSIYLDGYLHTSFSDAKRVMQKKNLDLVVVCSGYPGSGKSKIISQLASFCDPNFTEDLMFQNSEPFIEHCKNPDTKILSAAVLDEAWEGLSSSQVRKEIGRVLMSILNKVRQKRLFIFLVLPDFFDLSKNIAVFRSRWLIHCYGEEFGDVGRFAAFDRNAKRKLYTKGKKDEDYNIIPASCYGSFTEGDAENFNWHRYETKIKPEGLENDAVIPLVEKKQTIQRDKLINYIKNDLGKSVEEICKIGGMVKTTVYDALKRFKLNPSYQLESSSPPSY